MLSAEDIVSGTVYIGIHTNFPQTQFEILCLKLPSSIDVLNHKET
jgi:hypothetical protein